MILKLQCFGAVCVVFSFAFVVSSVCADKFVEELVVDLVQLCPTNGMDAE